MADQVSISNLIQQLVDAGKIQSWQKFGFINTFETSGLHTVEDLRQVQDWSAFDELSLTVIREAVMGTLF